MLKTGTRWAIADLTAETVSTTDDLIAAMQQVDFLKDRMRHNVKMTDTETGREFNWLKS